MDRVQFGADAEAPCFLVPEHAECLELKDARLLALDERLLRQNVSDGLLRRHRAPDDLKTQITPPARTPAVSRSAAARLSCGSIRVLEHTRGDGALANELRFAASTPREERLHRHRHPARSLAGGAALWVLRQPLPLCHFARIAGHDVLFAHRRNLEEIL